jgi:hypothetical protein
MKKRILIFSVIAVFIFSACQQETVDLENPTIEWLSWNPEPEAAMICGQMEDAVFHLKDGQQFQFEAAFKDNVALSQYKIDIHNNFDCHGHGGASAPGVSPPNVESSTEDWTVLQIINLEGKEKTETIQLQVPENVTAGNYHFQVQVIDQSGNDDPLANVYSIKILNSRDEVAPGITATQPTGNFSAARGESIQFEGTVTDNYSLSEGGNGILFLSYTDLSSGNTFTTDQAFVFDSSVTTDYPFSFSFTVPNTLVPGNYRFSLRAFDGVRNTAEPIHFEVEVTN